MKIADILKEAAGEIIITHGGRNVIDTKHSVERFFQRDGSGMDYEKFKSFLSKMIDKFMALKKDDDKIEEYLVFSRSLKQGVVIAFRKDKFDTKDEKKHFFIMTFLPPGKGNANPGTPKVMVESVGHNSYSPEFTNYIGSLIPSQVLTESTKSFDYNPVILSESDGIRIRAIMSNNSLLDMDYEVIEV